MAVDLTTDIGKVRALIPDTEPLPDPANPEGPTETLFPDAHIVAFLEQAGGSTLRAAAFAIDAIGMSEALISKVITSEDLATDGAKMMNAMQARATRYFSMADRADEEAIDSFQIVPFYLDHYEVH